MTASVLYALLCVPSVSHADVWDSLFPVVLVPNLTLSAIDAKMTYDCVTAKTCHEIGPALSPIVDRHGVGVAMSVKLGTDAAIAAAGSYALRTWPRRKREIVLAFMAGTAVKGFVVYRNRKTLERIGQ